MDEQPETTIPTEAKRSVNWWSLVLWPFMILVLYVLSSGPVLMLMEKRRIAPDNRFFEVFYTPLDWAYTETPLRKPLGIYLHLWTDVYDKNGEIRIEKMK
jgi:hypothetical protein